MIEDIIDDIRKHASEVYPREACGLITVFKGKRKYIPCKNIAETPEQHFILDPEDWAFAEDMGHTITAIFHSHPNLPAQPSQADLIGIERTQLPWVIMNWPVGIYTVTEPTGYKAPLTQREFTHGILDCYTLVKDYYMQELGIDLGDFHRDDKWWDKGQNLYLDNADSSNFVKVDKPEKHDIFLMYVGKTPVPNHAAVYIGDGRIMHHQTNRLSSIDVYGGYYQKITSHIFRHRTLL